MDREQIFDAVAAERRRIADLLDVLDETALATPSLCAGWDVKTVAAHLASVFADSFWTFQRAALRHGGFHRAIDELARRRARMPTPEIARTLRQRADHRLNPPVTGPLSGLSDVL
ncbi:MAG TPA: maleylpyruvate isomerase N-terminal domain-containing protein, partial [Mycobacterium sp.]|nr:maleylpyruvate isomerase N-terminal domain-containing protein [Mycobacterium sp.]